MRERFRMSNQARLVTAEELEKFPDDDWRYELVAGRVTRMTPVGFAHGLVAARLCSLLFSYVRARDLPLLVVTEVGFKLASKPDTVRAPDVAVVSRDRLPTPLPKGFVNGAPDLAIEVLSPDDRAADIAEKVAEYLSHGASVVMVIDPDEKTATLSRPAADPVVRRADDLLDLDVVVPGYQCRVEDLFG